jgi:hypothetical protein
MNNCATVVEPMKLCRIRYREFAGLIQFGQDGFLRLVQEFAI